MSASPPRRRLSLIAALLCGVLARPIFAADTITFAVPEQADTVSVTTQANRVYREAFRRLGLTYESRAYPGVRGILLVEEGRLDGLVHRARGFQTEHPTLIRVDESVTEVHIVAYTTRADLHLAGWDDLRASPLEVDWWRDVLIIGRRLTPLVTSERLEGVTTNESGLTKLLAGRADLFITLREVAEGYLTQPEFAGGGIRVADELDAMELYPYLAPQHEGLAPRLAEVLRQMKGEGVFARSHTEAGAEAEAPPP